MSERRVALYERFLFARNATIGAALLLGGALWFRHHGDADQDLAVVLTATVAMGCAIATAVCYAQLYPASATPRRPRRIPAGTFRITYLAEREDRSGIVASDVDSLDQAIRSVLRGRTEWREIRVLGPGQTTVFHCVRGVVSRGPGATDDQWARLEALRGD